MTSPTDSAALAQELRELAERWNKHMIGKSEEYYMLLRAAAALSASQAGGQEVALVPRIPTDAMVRAANYNIFESILTEHTASRIWRAMLAAAPPPVRVESNTHPLFEEAVEALRLLHAEMVASGNAHSRDYGWLPAIEKTVAVLAKVDAIDAARKQEGV